MWDYVFSNYIRHQRTHAPKFNFPASNSLKSITAGLIVVENLRAQCLLLADKSLQGFVVHMVESNVINIRKWKPWNFIDKQSALVFVDNDWHFCTRIRFIENHNSRIDQIRFHPIALYFQNEVTAYTLEYTSQSTPALPGTIATKLGILRQILGTSYFVRVNVFKIL